MGVCSNLDLRRFDLRFKNQDEEHLFRQGLERNVVYTGLVCHVIYVIGVLISRTFFDKEVKKYNFNFNDPRSYWTMSNLIVCAVLSIVAVMAFLRLRCSCCRFFNWEILLTISTTMCIMSLPWVNGWASAKLYGQDPDEVWVRDMRAAEGNVVLIIDAISTAICLFMPVRMIFKWIPPVLGVLSFIAFGTSVGSPFPGQLPNVFIGLSCLVGFALVGAWYNEQVSRQNFLAQRLVKRTSAELEFSMASQQDLLDEKTAFEMLLSMVCDATMWLSHDGKTILKCDERFDMLVGASMKNQSLSRCFASEEQSRLLNALQRVNDVPALVPTSIIPAVGSDSHITVDCFIVRHHSVSMDRGGSRGSTRDKEHRPTFLVGVRIAGQGEAGGPASGGHSYDKVQVLELLDGVVDDCKQADRLERIDEVSTLRPSLVETFETTSTGRIFKDIADMVNGEDNRDLVDDRVELKGLAELGNRQGWLLDAKDVALQPKDILGAGSFGVVVGAFLHGTAVAVKVPRVVEQRLHAKHLGAVANELRILRHVRHPNIILFFGAYVDARSEEICLVLERIMGHHLGKYVSQLKSGAQVHIRWQLILDVACGLRYLHAQRPRIVHGDLKDGNILVESHKPRAKLVDFGLARVLTKGVQPMGGSLKWMAPEVILVPKVKPRASSDVFSFGRVVYMVLSGRKPLEDFKRETILQITKAGQTMPLVWPDDMPLKTLCLNLCERTSSQEQEQRPSMRELHSEIAAWDVEQLDAEANINLAPLFLEMGKQFKAVVTPSTNDTDAEQGISGARQAMNTMPSLGTAQAVSSSKETTESLRLVLPGRKPTEWNTKLLMLTIQALQWNFPIPRGCCCPWHAVMLDMHSAVQNLWRSECKASFMPYTQYQCGRCGVLDIQRECGLCQGAFSGNSSNTTLATIVEEPQATTRFSL